MYGADGQVPSRSLQSGLWEIEAVNSSTSPRKDGWISELRIIVYSQAVFTDVISYSSRHWRLCTISKLNSMYYTEVSEHSVLVAPPPNSTQLCLWELHSSQDLTVKHWIAGMFVWWCTIMYSEYHTVECSQEIDKNSVFIFQTWSHQTSW